MLITRILSSPVWFTLQVWKDTVLACFTSRLLQIVSTMMVTEREEGLAYGNLITGVRDSFFHVSPQRSFFEGSYEQMYLNTLETYYTRVANERFTSGSAVDYARWAEQTFYDEHSRARKYLVPSKNYSEPINRMNEKLVYILIKNARIFDSIIAESRKMVEEQRNEALGTLFKLLDRVKDGPEPLIDCVKEYIVRCVNQWSSINDRVMGLTVMGATFLFVVVEWLESVECRMIIVVERCYCFLLGKVKMI